MGIEIRLQDGSGNMCLEVRGFAVKWWLLRGQPVCSVGKGDSWKGQVTLMAQEQIWCLKGDRINSSSPRAGTSVCVSFPQWRLVCV